MRGFKSRLKCDSGDWSVVATPEPVAGGKEVNALTLSKGLPVPRAIASVCLPLPPLGQPGTQPRLRREAGARLDGAHLNGCCRPSGVLES